MKGNFHVRFWSRVGKSDLLHLGNKHGGVKDKAVNSGKKSYEPTGTVRYKCHQIHWQKLGKLVVKLRKRSYQASHCICKVKYA